MSHAIRNTLILLFVLLLIYGSGYAYVYYIQKSEIETLTSQVSNLQTELDQKRETADFVPMLREQYATALSFIEGFDKTIFDTNNPDEIFRFLSRINERSGVEFNFAFQDSSQVDEYGIIISEITGNGNYRSFVNFINGIEHSEPVQKINNVSITPVGQTGRFNEVTFTFNLRSKYDRRKVFTPGSAPGITTGSLVSSHNPFFPLIRNVEPNVDNLPDIDNSRLVGVSNAVIYLLNQDGRMITLRLNDRVYLGYLESIDVRQGKALFRLNRGGIIDLVTLEVQR